MSLGLGYFFRINIFLEEENIGFFLVLDNKGRKSDICIKIYIGNILKFQCHCIFFQSDTFLWLWESRDAFLNKSVLTRVVDPVGVGPDPDSDSTDQNLPLFRSMFIRVIGILFEIEFWYINYGFFFYDFRIGLQDPDQTMHKKSDPDRSKDPDPVAQPQINSPRVSVSIFTRGNYSDLFKVLCFLFPYRWNKFRERKKIYKFKNFIFGNFGCDIV